MKPHPSPLAGGRSCGDCTLCCKLLGIAALGKPQQKWCIHCDVGKACRIYPDRPQECRTFHCEYLQNDQLGAHWRPSRSHMVLTYEESADRIVVHADIGRPDAWRREPYFTELKQWAVAAAPRGGQVIVWQGLHAVIILPDHEKHLGRIADDQVIVMLKRPGPAGPVYDAAIMSKNDPRLT